MSRAVAVALLILFTAVAFSQQPRRAPAPLTTRADAVKGIDDLSAKLAELEKSHAQMVQWNEKMSSIYFALGKKIEELGKAATAGGTSQAQLLQAIQQLQETQMNFNLQYLQLQNAMQDANRQFAMVSDIMKTKHDTVKNSINNIR